MAEHGKREVQPIEAQQKCSNEQIEDFLRFSPSKRVFMRERRKDESHKKKNVSGVKSNSKVLKRKRHKGKLKLFMDKDIWNPAMQIPCLGKSGKYYKKKGKIVENAQMNGNRIPHNTIYYKRASQIYPCRQPQPQDHSLDLLCQSVNVSHLPAVRVPKIITVTEKVIEASKTTNDLSDNDFLTSSSILVPFPDTSKILVGDLIDLGTPNSFDRESHRRISKDDDFCEGLENPPSMTAIDNVQSSFSGSFMTYGQPWSLNSDVSQSTVREESEKLAKPPGSNEPKLEHEIRQKPSFELGSSLSERSSSPLNFYGFPCINSPTKTHRFEFTIHHTHQTLLDHLTMDPYPKSSRGKAGKPVRRRAFSMDDALMAFLPCPPLEDIVDQEHLLQKEQMANVNGDIPSPMLQSDCSFHNSNESVEQNKHAMMGNDSYGIDLSYHKESSSHKSAQIHSSDRCSKSITFELSSGIVKDDKLCSNLTQGNVINVSFSDKDFERSAISSISATSDVLSSMTLNADTSKEDYACSRPENENKSRLSTEEDTTLRPQVNTGDIESPNNVGYELTTDDLAPDDMKIDTHPSPLNRNLICDDCTFPETIHPLRPPSCNNNQLTNGRKSIIKLEVSSDLAVKALHVAQDSPNVVKSISNGINSAPEMELLVQSSLDENGDGRVLPPQTPVQISTPSSSIEEIPQEISFRESDLLPTHIRSDANGGFDVEESCPKSSMYPLSEQENSKPVCSEWNSSDRPSHDIEKSIEGSVNNNDTASSGILAKDPNPNTILDRSEETIAEVNALVSEVETPTKGKKSAEIVTPVNEIVTPTSEMRELSIKKSSFGDSCFTPLEHWVLPAGKKFRRSLSIIRNLDDNPFAHSQRGRHYEKSVEEIITLQGDNGGAVTPVQSLCRRLSQRRTSWVRQITPPPARRSTFVWSPTADRGTLYVTPHPRKSIYSTPMQQNLIWRISRSSPSFGPRRPMQSPFNQEHLCSPVSPGQYTIRDLILTICKQTEPCSFSDILSEKSCDFGYKIGEGVFGEVFCINREVGNTVLKIIPIEGIQLVNGEKQKTYQEVLSELVIAKVLDELRFEGSDESNQTSGYAEVIATSLVQDCYPDTLLRFWEEFDRLKGSDNDNPKIFNKDQLYIVMEQSNGGKDLESYTFSSAKQSLSIFKQIAFSLAVAEMSVEFEHRDLHWGNVLVSKTSEKQIRYTLNGTQYSVASNGVKATIIDFTLSRIKYINQVPIYSDIGKDPEMFIATGDYQFDIYRFMKKDVDDDWSRFAPKTNARWLHYLLDKMLTKVKYQRKASKVHKDSFKMLQEICTWVEGCGSALSVALGLAELKY